MLADETISYLRARPISTHSCEALAKCAKESECDNCFCTNKGRKVCITEFVTFLASAAKLNNFDNFDNFDWYKTATNKVTKLPSVLTTKSRPNFDLQVDLHRYMKSFVQQSFFTHLNIYVKSGLIDATPIEYRHWYDVESINYATPFHSSLQHCKATEYPFVIYFERDRLGLNLEDVFSNDIPKIVSKACEQLFSKTNHPLYLSAIRAAETNEVPIAMALFYRAKLNFDGSLELLEPQRADDKRIYRSYGSDRFLEISIPNNVLNETIKAFLSSEILVGDRYFEFFWFKREAGIHPVLFAVSGQGIEKVSVREARSHCIPFENNINLSLGKWVKRMKLNFSTTTATCILPPDCVELIRDFEDDGVAQIDGAGLISSTALQAIWDGYKEKRKKIVSICPFSGFQGRLAG